MASEAKYLRHISLSIGLPYFQRDQPLADGLIKVAQRNFVNIRNCFRVRAAYEDEISLGNLNQAVSAIDYV